LLHKDINRQNFENLLKAGFDLGLLLPVCFVIGFLLYRKKNAGYIILGKHKKDISYLSLEVLAEMCEMK